MVHVAVLHLELFFPLCHSLKEKRSVLQRVLHRIRNHNAVTVAEVDHQDLWQRSGLAVAAISTQRLTLEKMFQKLIQDLDSIAEEFEISHSEIEWR